MLREYPVDPVHLEGLRDPVLRELPVDPAHLEGLRGPALREFQVAPAHREGLRDPVLREFPVDPAHLESPRDLGRLQPLASRGDSQSPIYVVSTEHAWGSDHNIPGCRLPLLVMQ
ncbi:hypothetical protein D3C74_384030 [compost metagenome]